MLCWRRLEKKNSQRKVTNKQVLEHIGEKRTLMNNILCRIANWIGHILRRNCLLHDAIEGQITEVKGVGRRRTQLLDDLRNKKSYWEERRKLKIEIDGSGNLQIKQTEEIHIYHKSMDLLISSKLNDNNILPKSRQFLRICILSNKSHE